MTSIEIPMSVLTVQVFPDWNNQSTVMGFDARIESGPQPVYSRKYHSDYRKYVEDGRPPFTYAENADDAAELIQIEFGRALCRLLGETDASDI